MSRRSNRRRSFPKNEHLRELLAIYCRMEKATNEEEFQLLLAEKIDGLTRMASPGW